MSVHLFFMFFHVCFMLVHLFVHVDSCCFIWFSCFFMPFPWFFIYVFTLVFTRFDAGSNLERLVSLLLPGSRPKSKPTKRRKRRSARWST